MSLRWLTAVSGCGHVDQPRCRDRRRIGVSQVSVRSGAGGSSGRARRPARGEAAEAQGHGQDDRRIADRDGSSLDHRPPRGAPASGRRSGSMSASPRLVRPEVSGIGPVDPDPRRRLLEQPIADRERRARVPDRARPDRGSGSAARRRASGARPRPARTSRTGTRRSSGAGAGTTCGSASPIGGAKWTQQMSASSGSRIRVTGRSNRRRPSRRRSHDVTPSRSDRASGRSPSSSSQRSMSAGRTLAPWSAMACRGV